MNTNLYCALVVKWLRGASVASSVITRFQSFNRKVTYFPSFDFIIDNCFDTISILGMGILRDNFESVSRLLTSHGRCLIILSVKSMA